jgi:hypothetical protein
MATLRGSSPSASQPCSIAPPILPAPTRTSVPVKFCSDDMETLVIPGPAESRSPESITTASKELHGCASNYPSWIWIPGSPLRGAPE